MRETLLRQWGMLKYIPRHPRKIDPPTLKARLIDDGYDITLRSIQRDLVNLARMFPLISDDAKPQGWSWHPTSPQIDFPALDPQAALTFHLVERYLQKLLPKSTVHYLWPWFETAKKVLNARGDGISKWPEKIRVLPRGLLMLPPDVNVDIQSTIYEALLQEIQIDVSYQPRGSAEIHQYVVHPYAIVLQDQVVYLVCTMRDYKDLRHLALHRIRSATLVDSPINRLPDFDLDKYIAAGHFGFPIGKNELLLEARFKKTAVAHIEECPLSEDQTIEYVDEEWAIVRSSVPDTSQLRWWLRGYGTDVQILGPTNLRTEFEEYVSNLRAIYHE